MSENIFTEIYNKILGLFGQNVQKDDSKDTAVNRLRLVLMQDRTNLTPEILHRMRSELIEVLSKYVELDKEALELNFEQEGEQMALMLSIPVVRAKDEAEIEEILKKEDEAKKANQTEEDTDDDSEDEEPEEASDDETEEDTENSEDTKDDLSADDSDEDSENNEIQEQNEDTQNAKSSKKPTSDNKEE